MRKMKVLHEGGTGQSQRTFPKKLGVHRGFSEEMMIEMKCELKIVGNFIKWEIKSITEKGKILCKGSGVESSLIGSRNQKEFLGTGTQPGSKSVMYNEASKIKKG